MMSSIWNSSNVGKKVHITVAWLPEPSYTFMLMRSASLTLATCSVKFAGMAKGWVGESGCGSSSLARSQLPLLC